jgi:hypothetical protein
MIVQVTDHLEEGRVAAAFSLPQERGRCLPINMVMLAASRVI